MPEKLIELGGEVSASLDEVDCLLSWLSNPDGKLFWKMVRGESEYATAQMKRANPRKDDKTGEVEAYDYFILRGRENAARSNALDEIAAMPGTIATILQDERKRRAAEAENAKHTI